MSFYTIVIIIAIVLLVIGLTIIGLTLNKKNNTVMFPEFQTSCPDFWTLDEQQKCIPSPLNTPAPGKYYSIRDISHNGIVFNDPVKPTAITSLDVSTDSWTSLCDKSRWAYKNGILWDGVSNNNSCPQT